MTELQIASGIIGGLPDAAILLDERLRVVDYNQAFLRFAGVGRVALRRALANALPFELFGEDPAEDCGRAQRCLASTETIKLGELSIRNMKNEVVKAHASFVPVVGPSGRASGIIYAIRDVSAESRLQKRYKVLIKRERSRANQLERRIENMRREARLAAVERDLELTGAVQSLFLPDRDEYVGERLRLNGFYLPADQCGGDWWWHEPVSAGKYVFMVGDATGHGPSAAMLTASVATVVEVQRELGHALATEEQIERIHWHVRRLCQGRFRMTLSVVEIDERGGQLTFHSAGGTPLLCMTDKSVEAICGGSRPLGDERFSIFTVSRPLTPNERILMFTDGLQELRFASGEGPRARMGVGALASFLEETRGLQGAGASEVLVERIRNCVSAASAEDDLTFVLADWVGEEESIGSQRKLGTTIPA